MGAGKTKEQENQGAKVIGMPLLTSLPNAYGTTKHNGDLQTHLQNSRDASLFIIAKREEAQREEAQAQRDAEELAAKKTSRTLGGTLRGKVAHARSFLGRSAPPKEETTQVKEISSPQLTWSSNQRHLTK